MAIDQTLQHKRSTVSGNIPSTSQVATGELAINLADRSIYTKNAAGVIIELAADVLTGPAFLGTPNTGDMWYNTTTDILSAWDGTTWVPVSSTGRSVLPANTTSRVGFSGGAGTSASPYTFSASAAVGSTAIIDTITVTGLNAGQYVPIIDLNAATNGGRFIANNNFADSTGTLVFTITFTDSPASAPSTVYAAAFQVGTSTVYINPTVTAVAVFPQSVNQPTNTLATSTSWTAPANTLTATGQMRISLDNVTYGTGPLSITTGATLWTRWNGNPGSGVGIDSAHGTTITGAVVSSNGGTASSSLTVDKTPDTITFTAITGAALNSTVISNTVTISGVNSYVYLTSSNTMTAAIGGGAFTTVPASGTSMFVVNGNTLAIGQTSSSSPSTATTVTLTAGGTTAGFTVTTGNNTVVTPTITTPTAGATGISPTATIVASAYATTGTVGTHLNSDWEIYSDAGLTTLVTSSMASTTNLTTWTPSGLANTTQYWVRVRYRSNDGTPIVSAWSPSRNWTTGVAQIRYPLTNTATNPTSSTWRTFNPGATFVPNDGIYTNGPISNMADMFYNSTTFNDPDVAIWDVSSVTNMSGMFQSATSFNQNIASWVTSNVTNMNTMFSQAPAFNANIASWNTSNVTLMIRMFQGAAAFNANIASWNTSKVTDMYSMFEGATVFNQNIASWVTSNVANMNSMFRTATAFNQNIAAWNTSNVTSMGQMFRDATAFNANIASWNTSKVTDMTLMFEGATSFNANIAAWNTSNVTNMFGVFYRASAFNQNIASWNTSNVTDMQWMFQDATSFNQNIASWNTTNVTTMSAMFDGATSFNTNIAAWNVSNVTNMTLMFDGATAFNQNIAAWNTSKVSNMSTMFRNSGFNSNIAAWITSNVRNMSFMFDGATAFNQNIAAWNTSNVTNMSGMFDRAAAFNQNIAAWNTSRVTNMSAMFEDATAFNQNISSWSVSNVTNMNFMFNRATTFNQNLTPWVTGLTSQPFDFSTSANTTWVASKATTFPFLQGGTIRINT